MDNDTLFALRTYYQDYYEDENDIIQMLKTNIMEQDNVNDEVANEKLYEFYKFYGIDIEKNVFKEVSSLPSLNVQELSVDNLFNLFFSNLTNSNLDEENNDVENNEENNDEENNDEENNDIENNDVENNEENNNVENNNEENNDIENNDIENNDEENNNSNRPIVIRFNRNNIASRLLNLSNTLSNIMSQVNINNNDVICTLDENEKDKLKKYKLENTLEVNCNICLDSLEENQEVIELPCEHFYHKDCIEVYINKYNYKCPCCRKEIGKPKYNI